MTVPFEVLFLFRAAPDVAVLRLSTSRPALFDGFAAECTQALLSSYLEDPGQPLTETERDLVARARWD